MLLEPRLSRAFAASLPAAAARLVLDVHALLPRPPDAAVDLARAAPPWDGLHAPAGGTVAGDLALRRRLRAAAAGRGLDGAGLFRLLGGGGGGGLSAQEFVQGPWARLGVAAAEAQRLAVLLYHDLCQPPPLRLRRRGGGGVVISRLTERQFAQRVEAVPDEALLVDAGAVAEAALDAWEARERRAEARLREVFREADADGDGVLSLEEWTRFLGAAAAAGSGGGGGGGGEGAARAADEERGAEAEKGALV